MLYSLYKNVSALRKGICVNFNTYSEASLCSRAYYLRYVIVRHQGHRIALLDLKKNATDKKQITILLYLRSISFMNVAKRSHFFKTLLIYAMKRMDLWLCLWSGLF